MTRVNNKTIYIPTRINVVIPKNPWMRRDEKKWGSFGSAAKTSEVVEPGELPPP
jgi:hypothetical protein